MLILKGLQGHENRQNTSKQGDSQSIHPKRFSGIGKRAAKNKKAAAELPHSRNAKVSTISSSRKWKKQGSSVTLGFRLNLAAFIGDLQGIKTRLDRRKMDIQFIANEED